jgi:hypothetical protein
MRKTKRFNDLTNRTFERLTVIRLDQVKKGHSYWFCNCICGNTITVAGFHLTSGHTKSCGCLQRELMSKRTSKNLIGMQFGRLTVIKDIGRSKRHNILWECLCICGKTAKVPTKLLTSGNTKSCGCLKAERIRWTKFNDLEGKKFGRLLVIKMVGRNKYNWPLWECKCDCGNTFEIAGTYLLLGHTKSCGCYRREFNLLPNNEGAVRQLVRNYKRNAKTRGLVFELTNEQLVSLVTQNCTYCGQEPAMVINGVFKYNSIDRVNNNQGYIFSNCTPCCLKCQLAKMDMSVKEFDAWTEKRYKWMQKIKDKKQIANTTSFKGGD